MNYRIFPPDGMIDATVAVPLSKSVANRQLVICALNGTLADFPEDCLPDADDSLVLYRCLLQTFDAQGEISLDAGAGGTTARFLMAFCASRPGLTATITGSERLKARPMRLLIDALRALGARIECLGEEGFLPVRISGGELSGGELAIDASVSSQFISALMLVAPYMREPLRLEFSSEEAVSMSYVRMTAAIMGHYGVETELTPSGVTVAIGEYERVAPFAERDWSAASYWYETAALSAGFITVEQLSQKSVQGDSFTARMFERLGVLTVPSDEVADALQLTPDPEQYSRFEEDLTDNPDLAPTLAVTAAMLGIPFHLRGLSTLKGKETDRLAALQTELDKFGIIVEIRSGSELVWNGERHPIFAMPEIDTYDDHRMAMAFAPTAAYVPGVVVNDVEVVSKSYPGFWDELRSAGFLLTDASVELPEAEDGE